MTTQMRNDQSLVAYISSTLSDEVLATISDDLSTAELWDILAETYSQVSEGRVLQLKPEFQNLKKGSKPVMEYLAQMKGITYQHAMIQNAISYRDKVQQILRGLGPEYDVFFIALEVLPTLPSFEELKAKLLQHQLSRK
ncbi:hypothetical protein EJ110_NYTH60415 [Nymphaea thermarum]|nr:hypothetical protein EJ110_NYTH60415 [Nymphaea thermarum]